MFRREYCLSYCAILIISIVESLPGPMNLSAAQTVSTLPHPDRIASNYPIRYGSATIESIKERIYEEIINYVRSPVTCNRDGF
jgi:hypothetical protein